MIVSTGKSRCQVKRIDGVDYCLNITDVDGDKIALSSLYKMSVIKSNGKYTAFPPYEVWHIFRTDKPKWDM